MTQEAPDNHIAESAAEWIMRLTCDDEQEREQAKIGFSAWKAADERHAKAARRIETLVAQVQGVREHAGENLRPVHAALQAAHNSTPSRRASSAKRVISVLLLAVAIALPTWVALDLYPPAYLLADVRNPQGKWITRKLEDGTRITLSGASAINLRYDAQQRLIELLEGEIFVDVAKDANRPFYIKTPLVSIRALGTRFAVSHDHGVSVLEMFESKVSIQTAAQKHVGPRFETVVTAGQRARLSPQGIEGIEEMDADRVEEGWRQHRLVIKDRPLPEVLDQLARHRSGRLYYDRNALAHLRLSGVLPLEDTDQALALLQANFPELKVFTLTSRWTWVGVKEAS